MKKIMKRAWEIAKNAAEKFGGKAREYMAEAIRMAWAEARETAKKAFSGIATMMWKITENAGFEVIFKLWENYGKKRIYFQSNSTRSQVALKGYIDCNNNNEIVISTKRYSGIEQIVTDFMNAYAF